MSDKTGAPCLSWHHPSAPPRAVLLCLHGLGLHAGMFKTFGERMARRGVITHALDIRGFGQWNKLQRAKLNFPACLEDIKEKLRELHARHPRLPIYLLGESLGGAISARFAAEYPKETDGLIIVSPARSIGDHKAAIAKVIFSLLTSPGAPINLSDVIARRAPRLVAAQNEATVRLNFSLSELLHLSKFMHDAVQSASRVTQTPVLMIQGLGDQLITPHSTMMFFEEFAVRDKDLIVVGDADHLMIQSPDVHPRAIEIVTRWIKQRSASAPLRKAS